LTQDAYSQASRSVQNAALNNINGTLNSQLANYAALGGYIDGPTDYSLMTDLLNIKQGQMQQKNKITTMPNSFGYNGGLAGTLFANGGLAGVQQTHGTDFTNGVTQVNAGGSHEQNPNQGVQMSVDSEGTPNLVEEGEVVWNDFVFSNRINVPKEVKRKFGIRGKKDITFADAAKKLQKESEERPNDPISKAGLNANLEELANAQEELKIKNEKLKMQEAFAKLSPEQQQQVMQELAARQQAA